MTKKNKSRTIAGGIQKKRSDTYMGTIEKIYGKDFGVRSDMKLGAYLKKAGYPSLSNLLRDGK
ncbi:MAG: hypothetical protein Q8P72_07040 [Candidatus Roizmanbacteria bacterium]|nr:hypothetical protein [Candidatus Roizmanbacteria bacterium]